jgi:transposase-like protein
MLKVKNRECVTRMKPPRERERERDRERERAIVTIRRLEAGCKSRELEMDLGEASVAFHLRRSRSRRMIMREPRWSSELKMGKICGNS